jgi:hypothetical protein
LAAIRPEFENLPLSGSMSALAGSLYLKGGASAC